MSLKILPSVHEILSDARVQERTRDIAEVYRTRLVRDALESARDKLRRQPGAWRTRDDVLQSVISAIEREARQLTTPFPARVINGTGVVIHTNLGRAPLGEALAQLDIAALSGYSNLEWNAATQKRGDRDHRIGRLLEVLTGAEAALAVNNCASALLLSLNTLARNKDVLVSRSELVEIGGGFRIPELIELSGCRLVEVGTTNKTRIQDYEKRATSRQCVLLKVHQSNFVQRGFIESVSVAELAALGRRLRVPVVYDNGSGLLFPARDLPFLESEPTVTGGWKAGATVVVFSADKLLGSIQGGLVIGKASALRIMRSNPMYRALRLDKVRIALLQYALREYLAGRAGHLPVWRMTSDIGLERLRDRLRLPGRSARWVTLKAQTGGGSNPESGMDSLGVQLTHTIYSPQALKEKFASRPVPILGYIRDNAFNLDVRTFLPGDFEEVQKALDELET